MLTKIVTRKGTTAQWSSANPILLEGEVGYNTALKKIKIGDGTTAWNSLPYHTNNVPLDDYVIASVAADVTASDTPLTAIGKIQKLINDIKALAVTLSGDQTISDVKTYTSSPIVPTPTTDMQTATKKYVDDEVGVVEAIISFPASNLVVGGNFPSTAGWTVGAGNSVLSVANNELSITGNGGGAVPSAYYDFTGISAHQYYLKGTYKTTNSDCSLLKLTEQSYIVATLSQSNPVANTDYPFSNVVTASGSGIARLLFSHTYADAATANGKAMKVKYLSALDLTAIFGTGNEPSKEEMDAIMALYPNSWFDGTANPLLTSKQIYNDKASKAQMAFISPTLVNSFANFGGADAVAGYLKDTLGFVHTKGKIKTGASGASPFTYAVGYRPSEDLTFPIVSNDVFGYCKITTAGVLTVYGNATYYSISSIPPFKAV